jgi:hypothetical protein
MQTVSQAWKDNQADTIVSESFVELTYEVGDPEAIADATATDNGAMSFSNTSLITNEVNEPMSKFATFEKNLWALDGSCKLLPDSAPYTGTGFVGEAICDNNGLFAVNPVITVSFSSIHSKIIPGITIIWSKAYDDYADSFIITAYNGSTVITTTTVIGNTKTISTILQDVAEYNKITVEITKWSNPNRRARIEEIFVGVKKVCDKSDLMNYKHSMSVDLLSAKLPKNEITFNLNNADGGYNPLNQSGVSKYLIERQRFVVRYGYKIQGSVEWINAGTFYLSEWNIPQNGITASFKARDLLEFMRATYTGTINDITLYDLALSALTQANLPLNPDGSVKWVLDSSLQDITVSATLDDKSIAEVLQMVANAACCVIYQDRDDKLHIEPLNAALTDYTIDQSNSFFNSELELSRKLKEVNVNKGVVIIQNDTDGEVQKVNNPLIPSTQAEAVGIWVKDTLKGRTTMNGEFRADPRLDALDKITVTNKYASSTVIVTDIEYTYNGAFNGKYEGRVI